MAPDLPVVIKLSGKALRDRPHLSELFSQLTKHRAIVVHGGGVEVDELLARVGISSERIAGLRVSPPEHMPYICAALCGMCNRQLQALALGCGCRALGLLATDGGSVQLRRYPAHYGQVASALPGERSLIDSLLQQGYLPLLCSIGIDAQGLLWNINADDLAAALAGLWGTRLYFISDVRGVLDQNHEIIPQLDRQTAARLIASGIITDGMLIKVKMALRAAAQTGRPVTVAALDDPGLCAGLFAGRTLGTSFVPEPPEQEAAHAR